MTESGYFLSSDGTQIFYEVRGKGKPLLFCYGITCKREHWHHQTSYFENNYQIITFDYRGHHSSGIPQDPSHLTLEWCARDLAELVDHLKLEEVVLLGHSMGVPVLLEAAPLLKSKVRGNVFVCGVISNPFKNMFFVPVMDYVYQGSKLLYGAAPETFAWTWQRLVNIAGVPLSRLLGFNPKVAQGGDIVGYVEGVLNTPFDVFFRLLQDYCDRTRDHLIEKVSAPSLVIAGKADLVTPFRVQEAFASRLANGKLFAVPYGSHNAHSDFPKEVNAEIEAFLKRWNY